MNPLLGVAEAAYTRINAARRALYRRGVLKAKRLGKPVISIGNITAGGAGKTPAVIALCRHLRADGLRVAVLTRGYGREDARFQGLIPSNDAVKYGDEPVLIKSRANVDVIVGSKRYENARRHECDVYVLDDGFQHLQLARDLDIVIDAPGRFHREARAALEAADVVIPRELRLAVPESLRDAKVFAFAGLADNEQFFTSLRAAGVAVTGTRGFPDHHNYSAADRASLHAQAKGATLVTTEKDAVKLAGDPSIVAVPAEFVIPSEVLDRALAVARGTSAATAERRKRTKKGAVLQRVEYLAYRGVARAVAAMSDESIQRWGTRLGVLARRVLARRDRLAMKNLRRVFPDRDARALRKLLDDCWRHFGREVLQTLQMQNLPLDEIAKRCPFINVHHLEAAMARGKGTILISAHWGGWEIAGLAIMSLVKNVRTVARPLDNELLERDMQKIRAATGAEVVDRRRAARVLLRGLSENAVLVLLPDQAVLPREGVLVPFLGHPGWTTPAPAKMALRAGATIVFGFCIPDGLRHRLEFEEPIYSEQIEAEGLDAEALTSRINEIISRRILAHPELWLWMHDRWKWTEESEQPHGV